MDTILPEIGSLIYYPEGNEFGIVYEYVDNEGWGPTAGKWRIRWEGDPPEGGCKSTDPFPNDYLIVLTANNEKERLAAILKYGS